MRFAYIGSDPVVGRVMQTAAERRGHECLVLSDVNRLDRPLPFPVSVVVLAVRRFDESINPSISHVRERCPGAGVIVTAELIEPNARSAALRDDVIDVTPVPYNPYDVITVIEHWLGRRPAAIGGTETCSALDLHIDLDTYQATKAGIPFRLTRLEMRLLYCLCEHYPSVASTERLLSFGWAQSEEPDSTGLKTHISHVRQRLRSAPGIPMTVHPRRSIGYVLSDERTP